MRLIDADALEKEGWSLHRTIRVDKNTSEYQTKPLKQVPTIEPERKKGKWIDAVLPNDSGGLQVQVCNQCNTFFPLAYTGGGHNFCPNCGADMRGDDHDL